jgi:hypothetical protein
MGNKAGRNEEKLEEEIFCFKIGLHALVLQGGMLAIEQATGCFDVRPHDSGGDSNWAFDDVLPWICMRRYRLAL